MKLLIICSILLMMQKKKKSKGIDISISEKSIKTFNENFN